MISRLTSQKLSILPKHKNNKSFFDFLSNVFLVGASRKVKCEYDSGFFQSTRTDQKSSKKFYKFSRGQIVQFEPRN